MPGDRPVSQQASTAQKTCPVCGGLMTLERYELEDGVLVSGVWRCDAHGIRAGFGRPGSIVMTIDHEPPHNRGYLC